MHIVICVPPLTGHVIPSLGLAKMVVENGHRVTYVTHGKYRREVESVGARLVATSTEYGGLSSGFVSDPVLGPIISVIRSGTSEIQANLTQLTRYFSADPPDVVCVNYASQLGFALADCLARPRVTLYPTFAWSRCVEEKIYGRIRGDSHIAQAIQERKAVATRLNFTIPRHVPFGSPSGLNLVSIPRSFQWGAEEFDETFVFMGPSVVAHPGSTEWNRNLPDRPLVYISLGTTYTNNLHFFRRCIDVFSDGVFEVAMSIGDQISFADLGSIPENFEVRNFLPQVSVLSRASVFVTHGGTGSVMEAISLQVPMVALPQQGDQALYAQKIESLGVGVDYSKLEDPELTRLHETVTRVNSDVTVRRRLASLRAEIAAEGGLQKGVQALEEYIS